MTKTVLALDIGGTNSRLALYSYEKNKIKLVSKEVYPTHDVKTYEKTIYDFIKEKILVFYTKIQLFQLFL